MTTILQDPYYYSNFYTFRNKFDITDPDELHDEERNLSNLRAEELLHSPMKGRFNFAHFCKIHHYLFQDIYDWAGEVRTVGIAKGNLFCRHFAIDSEATRIFTELKQEKYLQNFSVGDFAKRLTYFFSEVNALHPFREDNGRTQRKFFRINVFSTWFQLVFCYHSNP